MCIKSNSSPPEPTHLPDQIASRSTGSKRFGKKLYAITALIAVVIIAIAFFIPQGSAIIPLNVNYTVGEKMVYDTTMTGAFQIYNSTLSSEIMRLIPSNMSLDLQQTIEVIDFDGEYYTLNRTSTLILGNKPYSSSMLERINKTGYSTYILDLGNATREIPSTSITGKSYLIQLLSQPEGKVGDTINVPFPSVSSNMGITGDLTMTFRGFEDLTVPAGTYKVFRIDIKSNNLGLNYNPSVGDSSFDLATNMNIDINYEIYMEYETLRQIKSRMQQTVSYQSAVINYTMNLTMDMTLIQYIKP